MTNHDVIIIGAGAAGLMCAIAAGRRGRRVLLMDHAAEPGAKILISGGGRCNFTNLGSGPENFFSDNPAFCRSALTRFSPRDFLAMVEAHHIGFHEKAPGQLFCDGSARAILAMLRDECAAAGVRFAFAHQVSDIARADRFIISTDHGPFSAESLVLATGGLSIPKLGATGFSHEWARRFGLGLTEIAPALVPLTLDGADLELARPLAGVSLACTASIGRTRFADDMLFTHRGLSGPAILQISTAWRTGPILLDLLPGTNAADLLLDRKRARPRTQLAASLAELLPTRLANALAPHPAGTARLADLPDRELRALAARLNRWGPIPAGTEGFAKAEVTRGGVDTRDLSSRSMMARDVPGLFVIGEAVDVTGWLGGHNFQWAWSSGWAAGSIA